MIVIGDICPLAVLARVDRLGLLRDLKRPVVVPASVREAFQKTGHRLPWFIKVQAATNRSYVEELRSWLDEHEAEAIALFKEISADVLLIDDHLGRRIAKREGVRSISLLGFLVAAKRAGSISSFRSLFMDIKNLTGYRVIARVEKAMMGHAGEA